MTVYEIPVATGPAFSQTISLDGVRLSIRCWWNARGQRWFIDIGDGAGNAIASGLGLVVGVPLLRRFGKRPDLPPGALIAVDTSGQGLEAGYTDLGGRVRLTYLDAEEVERIEAGSAVA